MAAQDRSATVATAGNADVQVSRPGSGRGQLALKAGATKPIGVRPPPYPWTRPLLSGATALRQRPCQHSAAGSDI